MKRINWTSLNTFIIIGLPIIGCIIAAIITVQYQSHQSNKQYAEELAEAQRPITKRHAESKRHNQLSPLLKNPLDQPPSQPTYKDSTANMTDRIEHEGQIYRYFAPGEKHMFNYRYEDGMYKGMNYPEAYTAWKARRDKVFNRLLESGDKALEFAEATRDSANAEMSLILTIFKSMSPKELEKAKTETLKDYPKKADEIESFFNDVANHDTTKSLEEIAKDTEFIRESAKVISIAAKKNDAEIDKIREELDQIDREKPQRPTFQ